MAGPTDHVAALRRRLGSGDILVAPGVFDALSALVAEQAGFEAIYLSGASIAYTRLGRPDLGLVSMSEVLESLRLIRERVALPLIVDGDTGFGNALNLQRTVRAFEMAGASAIQIEDQQMPKRCGHLDGKTLVPAGEMVGKIHAFVDARQAGGTLLVARTDAIAVEGIERALDRAEAYVEAGADVLFIEAPRSPAELAAIVARFQGRIPLLANMIEGGNTPLRSAAELGGEGFDIAIFPGGLVRALAHAMQQYFGNLKANGSNAAYRDRMFDFGELNRLVGLPELLATSERFAGGVPHSANAA